MKSREGRFRGWHYFDWESFDKHSEVVRRLKIVFESQYKLRTLTFNPEEAEIARQHRVQNPHYYVAHTPDIVVSDTNYPEKRYAIEYVNSDRSFLRDMRGMLALSIVYVAEGFILAIRNSIYTRYALTGLHKKSKVEIMSLKSLLDLLDRGDLTHLLG